jgi:hypothetical protein
VKVRDAITSRVALFIFEELLKYEVESSPLYPEATDEELVELGAMCELLKLMQGERAKTARRFMRYAFDEIREAAGVESHASAETV